MKRILFLGFIALLALSLLLPVAAVAQTPPNEGDTPTQSSLHTDYFTIFDPGGGAQPPMTYTDSQTHVTEAGLLQVCLQDVGVNPTTPPSWADDIANVYVDGVLIGTYDSLNNPMPAPGPGPVQCFTTMVSAGSHVILVELVYSAIAGSLFAKEIGIQTQVGGIAIFPVEGSGSSSQSYAFVIGGAIGVLAVLVLGSWYARRRWLQRI